MVIESGRTDRAPDTVVFGATGFIGRWTVLHLLDQGRTVAAVLRERGGMSREAELRGWLRDRGAADDRLVVVAGDLTGGPGLGLSSADDERLAGVRDVFNTAALYRFGLQREEARAVNVEGALNVLHWAAARRDLRRLVHVSGYRVGLDRQARYPLPEAELAALYRDKGAYEGSKFEADAAVRVVAARLAVPLTVVNPSSVIGHSSTGEAGQYIGLAELVRQLWTGRLPALPGTARTFVPVVTVDHFARFMAAVPEHDPEPGGRHWVLDADTPGLSDVVRMLADHLGVRAPRTRVPVSLVRRLPTALTGADPETLDFLVEDRYDTASADRVAEAAGLRQPPAGTALRRWADRLVADRFGATSAALPGGFHDIAGSRTYLAGDWTSPDFVLLHGLPLDGESWRGVLGELGDSRALVPDLPGLGRSAPTGATPPDWLADLLAPVRTRPVIVAHSAATAPALRFAAAHPDRIAGVLLVSPYFLQAEASKLLRALAAPLLKRISVPHLTAALLGVAPPAEARQAVASAVAQLRRPGVARRTGRWLRDANRPEERAALRALLSDASVHIVAGQQDPLISAPGSATVTTIPGAGHNPQLTHPAAVAAVMRRVGA
ncbi:alpha/beta fold hydrolase [Saccharopolyspora elongata]|uniref:Alpha/beta fold hydrolase n=1 Tax=Saccharopolyspora elongata TaxID=2530387 RepID=A0A4R4YFP7_9PSEU|nr:alpha/beta fold hydrolase [Saccharopolyspora elongata]TDD43608.1 alpha/beta fold hydrolase [Saccharopolyspora elongata]